MVNDSFHSNFLSFFGQNFSHLSLNGFMYFSNEISLLFMFIKIKSHQTLDLISFKLLFDLSNFTELCLFIPPI